MGYEDGRPYYSNTPLDANWKIAIRIVKESITPRLNEQIKDYHILVNPCHSRSLGCIKELCYITKRR